MAFRHGVYTSEIPTSILPSRSVDSNVVFCVGASAVHTLADDKPRYVNKPRCFYSYDEFVTEMGWDGDHFNDYSLQELIYSHFALYRGAPVVAVNVFDPAKHNTSVSGESLTLDGDSGMLPHGGVFGYVVKLGGETCTEGTDYGMNRLTGELSRIEGGKIAAGATVTVDYKYADVSKVTSDDIIGGIDMDGNSLGLELVDSVFPLYRIVPGSILAPKYCEDPAVAVIMAAKAENINGLFQAIAIVDIPSSGPNAVRKYTEVPAYKQNNNLADPNLVVCWPKVKLGDMVFGLGTQLTGLMSQTDYNNGGIPYESASNKNLSINSIGFVDDSGEWQELSLGMEKVNYLNGEGIFSALNWDGGLRSWGGRMSCYPTNTDPKDCQEPIRRMFNWYRNTFVLTYFQRVDAPMTRRFIQTILKSEQIRLDGYTSREILLGGSISFDEPENPLTDLIDGICRFHLRLTPPPAARDIECSFEFDVENLNTLFG